MNTTLPGVGEVHLWPMSLDLPVAQQDRLADILSDDEQQRAATFRDPLHRGRYVAARGQLREILGHYLGTTPGALEFCYGPYGKPSLRALPSPLQFNVSHSHGQALCAVTAAVAIGVDIERRVGIDDLVSLARHIMSPLEVLLFAELPPASRLDAFYDCWTRKEAYLKARGLGVAVALQKVSVSLASESRPKLLQCENEFESVSDWNLHSFRLHGGFTAAVAVLENPAVGNPDPEMIFPEKIHCCTWQRPWSAVSASMPGQTAFFSTH